MKTSNIIEIKLKRITPSFGENEMLLSEFKDYRADYQIIKHPDETNEQYKQRVSDHYKTILA